MFFTLLDVCLYSAQVSFVPVFKSLIAFYADKRLLLIYSERGGQLIRDVLPFNYGPSLCFITAIFRFIILTQIVTHWRICPVWKLILVFRNCSTDWSFTLEWMILTVGVSEGMCLLALMSGGPWVFVECVYVVWYHYRRAGIRILSRLRGLHLHCLIGFWGLSGDDQGLLSTHLPLIQNECSPAWFTILYCCVFLIHFLFYCARLNLFSESTICSKLLIGIYFIKCNLQYDSNNIDIP